MLVFRPVGAARLRRDGRDDASTPRPRREAGVPRREAATGDVQGRAQAEPAPKPKAARTGGSGSPKPPADPRTRAAAARSRAAGTRVEAYYLRLMNCTRTGGWVTSGGACSSPGGRDVAPLVAQRRDQQHASRGRTRSSSRPATTATTSSAGTPGDRLRRAGFTQLPLGREPRLPVRQPVQRRPRLAPVLPEREAVQRRPLPEPDERRATTGSASASGCPRPRPPGDRLLPPLIRAPAPPGWDHRAGDGR